ncbi:hypothetical protein AQJ46_34415 [Streptomyces canus]|uniref:Major facilitator superfamily (MFS) profile domain-containing protein n=1 Tax=Streptomyces canus TaxID=58343 RepID=A0A117QYP8_9ACTN|nr:hypothetical protein AQJ46_34415 [Streptomyces canus]
MLAPGAVSLITDVSSEMVTAVLPLYVVAGLGLPGDYGSDLWAVRADGTGTARRLMTSAVAPAYLG